MVDTVKPAVRPPGAKDNDRVTLTYTGKGSAVVGGMKWQPGVARELYREEAEAIWAKLPMRFRIRG